MLVELVDLALELEALLVANGDHRPCGGEPPPIGAGENWWDFWGDGAGVLAKAARCSA